MNTKPKPLIILIYLLKISTTALAVTFLILMVVGCSKPYTLREGMPLIFNGQYGTILPTQPKCIAEKLRSDLLNPNTVEGQEWLDEADEWDFNPATDLKHWLDEAGVRHGYIRWTKAGTTKVGYSTAEDATVWNNLYCVKVKG